VAILGDTPTRKPIAAAVGDSIAWGVGDSNADGGGGFPGHGFISRSLLAAKIPYNRVANPGDRLSRWTQPLYSYRRYNWLPGVKNVIHEYGINDIEGGAATQALVQTNMVKSWKMIADMGCDIWQTTLTPFTTTTDNWATEGNQTVSTKQAVRIAVNAWIRDGGPLDPTTKLHVASGTSGALRAGQAGHPIKGYIEIADAVETARDSGKWKTNGSAFGYTGDGVHPNGRATALMSAVLTSKLTSMGY
jgi:lysophospholipase L1-like esterase